METLEAIASRRSIRKYLPREVSDELVEKIVRAGMLAPSAKNRQPWSFVAVKGEAKEEMLQCFRQGILREQTGNAVLPGSKRHLPGAEYTVKILEEAPVSIWIVNPLGTCDTAMDEEGYFYEIANVQSVGAAVENMALAAASLGLGSLWICDIFFAYEELSRWLGAGGKLMAALALGYPAEQPSARPRKPFSQVFQWK